MLMKNLLRGVGNTCFCMRNGYKLINFNELLMRINFRDGKAPKESLDIDKQLIYLTYLIY